MSSVELIVLKCFSPVYDAQVVDELEVSGLAGEGDGMFLCNEMDCVEGIGLRSGKGWDIFTPRCESGAG